jgi:hypothetical protein
MAQRFYEKASVQVAIISAVTLLLVTAITIFYQRSSVVADNARLLQKNQKQAQENQRLETLLTPFRTIALQRFSGPEGEALKKLADQITALDKSLFAAQTELASVKVQASYPKMRRMIDIRPNGREVVCTGNRAGTHSEARSSSVISDLMEQFFESMGKNDRLGAAKALDQIITTTPDWPYGYFYRGVITGNTNDFNKAAELFSLVKSVEIIEPEPLLFEALNYSYLGDEQAAIHSLDAMENTHMRLSDVSLLFFPPHCSDAMLTRLKAISDKLGMTSAPKSKN